MQVDLSGMQAYEALREIRDGLQLPRPPITATNSVTTYRKTIREETGYSRQVRMTLTRTAESHEAAFAMLEEMLTDESLTPFTTVSMDHTGAAANSALTRPLRWTRIKFWLPPT